MEWWTNTETKGEDSETETEQEKSKIRQTQSLGEMGIMKTREYKGNIWSGSYCQHWWMIDEQNITTPLKTMETKGGRQKNSKTTAVTFPPGTLCPAADSN